MLDPDLIHTTISYTFSIVLPPILELMFWEVYILQKAYILKVDQMAQI